MAAVIVEATPDARAQAKALLAKVENGQIHKDAYTCLIEKVMRAWGEEE
jgi:hypothetical protein